MSKTNSESEEFKIVPYSPSDLDRMMEIELVSFTAPWTRESYEELSELDTVSIWVVKDEDDLAGYMLLQHIGEEMELHAIAVSPEYRRKGVAKMMMKHMMSYAKDLNVHKIFLQVRPSNLSALSLYNKFGFMPVGIRKKYYYDNNEDAYILQTDI